MWNRRSTSIMREANGICGVKPQEARAVSIDVLALLDGHAVMYHMYNRTREAIHNKKQRQSISYRDDR
jgi:hypothetical protein